MSKPTPSRRPAKNGKHKQYLLRLFMAGNGLNSRKALFNLRVICKAHMNGNCRIETVDVVKDFQTAVRENILITPALIMVTPLPRVVILGNLSDHQKVLEALRLVEVAS